MPWLAHPPPQMPRLPRGKREELGFCQGRRTKSARWISLLSSRGLKKWSVISLNHIHPGLPRGFHASRLPVPREGQTCLGLEIEKPESCWRQGRRMEKGTPKDMKEENISSLRGLFLFVSGGIGPSFRKPTGPMDEPLPRQQTTRSPDTCPTQMVKLNKNTKARVKRFPRCLIDNSPFFAPDPQSLPEHVLVQLPSKQFGLVSGWFPIYLQQPENQIPPIHQLSWAVLRSPAKGDK